MQMEAKAGTEKYTKAGMESEEKVGTEREAKAGMMGRVRQLRWCHNQTIAGGSRSGLCGFRVLAESVLALQDVHPLP